MKIFRSIVMSNKEPESKDVIWLYNGVLKYYSASGWEDIKQPFPEDTVVGNINSNNEITLDESLVGNYHLWYEDTNKMILGGWEKICLLSHLLPYTEFINYNIAPYSAAHIGVYNDDGTRVGKIKLEHFKPTYDTRLFRFGILSDVHNSSDESAEPSEDIQRALKYFNDKLSVSFTCICGDLTNSASETGFSIYKLNVLESSPNTPVYATTGNHDAQSELNIDRWRLYVGTEPTYEYTHIINNIQYHFLFLGMYYWSLGTNGNPYRELDIDWLANKLELYRNEKCFVITHLFFPDRAGNLLKIYPLRNWLLGNLLIRLESLCKEYPSTIWFSGHSHWKWHLLKYQDIANIYKNEPAGSYCVHISSCASPIDSNGQPGTSDARVTKPLESEGAIIDVYENYIDIRCMDLKNSVYLPIALYRLIM